MNTTSKPLPSMPSEGEVSQNIHYDIPSNEEYRPSDIKEMKQNNSSGETKSMSPKKRNMANKESPNYNTHNISDTDEEFEFFHEFKREKVKDVIHHITSFLKQNAMDIEYLMIPFRPEQSNEKLLKFLNTIFPLGNGQPVNEKSQMKIINKTDVWTLFQSLKYIWCRLPNSEIVGWKAYLKFKYKEIEKNYPQKAFLEIMPQCLDSPNHASIVYDFFDLIVTLSSNSRVNKMSARKVAKMCALWAFKKSNINTINDRDAEFMDINNKNSREGPSYDFDANNPRFGKINNSFQDGLNEWVPASDAMFHLLLSFLKSFVPRDLESSKLPKSLKSILFNNEYPPKGSTAYTSQTILTIPLVTLYTDEFSRKPWQLLERCNDLLDFSNHDAFEAREDYALLKSLFKKKNNVEGISRKMSQESRRLMKIMSTKHSTFQAGWAPRRCVNNIYELKENIQIQRVDIDDYFIWTWLSSLSYEETSEKKKIFGRSLILEFEFDGFKKWVAFEECDITLHYRSTSQFKKNRIKEKNDNNDQASTNSNKGRPLPTKQNSTPVYEKFQQEVPNQSISKVNHSVLNSPSLTPQGQYHTIIDRPSSHKNHKPNLHVLEEKISKWNPLNNLRKKSNSIANEKNDSTSSPEMKKEFVSSSIYDSKATNTRVNINTEQNSNNLETKSKARVISQYSLLDPQKYQLPEIEKDEEGFHIDLSNISNSLSELPPIENEPESNMFSSSQKFTEGPDNLDSKTQKIQHNIQPDLKVEERYHVNNIPTRENRIPPTLHKSSEHVHANQTPIASYTKISSERKERHSAAETLEELSDMVDGMMSQDEVTKVQAAKTFEEMTKFDKYKPKDFDAESSISSAVPSLKINATIDGNQKVSESFKNNMKNTNYRQRINFSAHSEGIEKQDFTNQQYNTENITTYNKKDKIIPQPSNTSVDKTDPQQDQFSIIPRDNQHAPKQQGNISPTYDSGTYTFRNSLERGRMQQQTQEQLSVNESPLNVQQNYQNPTYQSVQPVHQNEPYIVANQTLPTHSLLYNQNTATNNNAPNSLPQDQIYQQQWINSGSRPNSTSPVRVKPQSQPQVSVQPQVSPQPYNIQPTPAVGFNNKQYQELNGNYANISNQMHTAPRTDDNNNFRNGDINNNYDSTEFQSNRYQQDSSKHMPDYRPSVQQPIFTQDNMNKTQTPPINNYNYSLPPTMMNKTPIRGHSPNFNEPSPSPNMQQGFVDNRERMQISPIPKQSYPQTQRYAIPVPINNGMKPNMYIPPQQQSPYHHPNHLPVQNVNMSMNPNRSPQLDGYANHVHPAYGNNYGNNNINGANSHGTVIPSDIPVATTHNTMGIRLHGNNINKKQERKQLYNNIRSGNFGI